jgi:hypothetical protein
MKSKSISEKEPKEMKPEDKRKKTSTMGSGDVVGRKKRAT